MPSTVGFACRVPTSSPPSIESVDPPVNTDVSMPDEKARPFPITTNARMSPSSRTSLPSARSSCHILMVKELSFSGRLSRSQATCPSRVSSTVS